jgi:hypothetical protein
MKAVGMAVRFDWWLVTAVLSASVPAAAYPSAYRSSATSGLNFRSRPRHTGYFITIGKNSAPVYSHAGLQRNYVSTGSMEAEYVGMTEACKKALLFRFLLSDLGFAQHDPITCYEDNKSAICLAEAPQITRHSRNIFVRHHYIRNLVAQNLVKIQYLPTADMTANLLTKPINTKAHFKHLRAKLLSTSPDEEAPWTSNYALPTAESLSIVSGGV